MKKKVPLLENQLKSMASKEKGSPSKQKKETFLSNPLFEDLERKYVEELKMKYASTPTFRKKKTSSPDNRSVKL